MGKIAWIAVWLHRVGLEMVGLMPHYFIVVVGIYLYSVTLQ